eukprot:TRINITY_DN67208_c10_g3_i1.p1 TRINITY_DN67208_c10_g3~~TRINITY_DN67208_c10_g3_i1.p1  ORF type:complete len:156 (+),score=19.18 TRINITY_DN67208_c10_g3_i1:53-520(+)
MLVECFIQVRHMLLRQTMMADPEFRWCSAKNCGSGQLVEGGADNPIMRCVECQAKTCYTHRVEWHTDKTCAQYDLDKGESAEAQLLHWVQRNAKSCPKCGHGIEKNGGCDHMVCDKKSGGCGHEFCWRCQAPYKGETGILAVGNTAHEPTCTWHM